ncbi:MAG: hypothetical protein AB1Z98_35665 [Nannocystaceae bacterium]
MSAAIDLTRWGRRPVPRSLDDLAAIARRSGGSLQVRLRLRSGWAELWFCADRVIHAKHGWSLGRRALVRIAASGPWLEVTLRPRAAVELLTIDEPWARVRRELLRSPSSVAADAATPRSGSRMRGVGVVGPVGEPTRGRRAGRCPHP